jgi:hypothetical protein
MMKLSVKWLFAVIFLASSQVVFAETKLVQCGTEWINIHKENPDLIGIYVQQFPDNNADKRDYIGKHPSMIIYLFKNDRVHIVGYTPTGQVEEGGWSSVSQVEWVKKAASQDFKLDVECRYWVGRKSPR